MQQIFEIFSSGWQSARTACACAASECTCRPPGWVSFLRLPDSATARPTCACVHAGLTLEPQLCDWGVSWG